MSLLSFPGLSCGLSQIWFVVMFGESLWQSPEISQAGRISPVPPILGILMECCHVTGKPQENRIAIVWRAGMRHRLSVEEVPPVLCVPIYRFPLWLALEEWQTLGKTLNQDVMGGLLSSDKGLSQFTLQVLVKYFKAWTSDQHKNLTLRIIDKTLFAQLKHLYLTSFFMGGDKRAAVCKNTCTQVIETCCKNVTWKLMNKIKTNND